MYRSFFRFLNKFWSDRPAAPRAVKARRRANLNLENLEERAVPALIGGYVYYDVNNTGILEPNEPGIANQQVVLQDTNGHTLATTTTNSNGQYQFSTNNTISTTPQTVNQVVKFSNSVTGNSQTQTVTQFDPSKGTLTEVDIIDNGTLTSSIKVESTDQSPSTIKANVSGTLNVQVPGEKTIVTQLTGSPVTTNVGAFDGTIDFAGASGHDFGSQSASGSSSTTLLSDQNDLSPFIGTGTLNITNVANSSSSANGPGNLVANINSTSQSNVTIIYKYVPSNSLTPGNYKVVQPNFPSGYIPGLLTDNNQNPIPNSAGQNTIPVTLTNNNSLSNNFGNLKAAGLSGFVYHDPNDNGIMESGEEGIGGVRIQLAGTNDLGAQVNLNTVTGQDGSYNFANLRPGTYTLTKLNTPAGYIDGQTTIGSQGGTVASNQLGQIVLNSGTLGINNNFAEYKGSSLSGYEYVDKHNTGVMDNNDPGIAGVHMLLTGTDNKGNQVNLSATTNSTGFYQFNTLVPGNYTVTQVPPAGYLEGPINVGSLGGTAVQDAVMVQLGREQSGTSYNFGHPPPLNPIPVTPSIPDPVPLTPSLSKFWLIY